MAKILIVDDSPTVLFKMARDLEAMGHEPVGASAVDEALRYLRYSSVDLVLLDLEMMPVSGIEVGRRLQEVDPSISIVIHSSKSTSTLIDAASQLSAVGIVRKGCSRERLQAVLDRSLRLRRASGERPLPSAEEGAGQAAGARHATR